MTTRPSFQAVIDEADALFAQAAKTREKLLRERQELLDCIDRIDEQLSRIPGSPLSPVSLDEWKLRRERLRGLRIGRGGVPLNTRDIIHATSAFYGVKISDIQGTSRKANISRTRHVAMYLARRLTRDGSIEQGETFGRDHTTVLEAARKIEDLLTQEPQLAAEVQELERAIHAAKGEHAEPEAAE